MNYKDEQFLLMQKEILLEKYNCNTIAEVIKILEFKISKKNKKRSLRDKKNMLFFADQRN